MEPEPKPRLSTGDVTAHLQPGRRGDQLDGEPGGRSKDRRRLEHSAAHSLAGDELDRRFMQAVRRWAQSRSIALDDSWRHSPRS